MSALCQKRTWRTQVRRTLEFGGVGRAHDLVDTIGYTAASRSAYRYCNGADAGNDLRLGEFPIGKMLLYPVGGQSRGFAGHHLGREHTDGEQGTAAGIDRVVADEAGQAP